MAPTRHEIAAAHRRDYARDIAESVAADLAELREKSGATLEEIAGSFGRGRAWLNKLETARIQEISLADYLSIVNMLEGRASEHPAVKLSAYLKGRKRRLRVVDTGRRT